MEYADKNLFAQQFQKQIREKTYVPLRNLFNRGLGCPLSKAVRLCFLWDSTRYSAHRLTDRLTTPLETIGGLEHETRA
jgi:hypothetical protein